MFGSSGTGGIFTSFNSMSNGPTNGFMGFSGMNFGGNLTHQRQDPPVEHKLNLTLEELYSGCTKKMKISRQVQSGSGSSKEDKILFVDVKPGWKSGTKVTFSKEGDQVAGKIPSDIVFVIGEKPHTQFTREGNNLRHKVRVTLKNALCGGTVTIPTIEGEKIRHTLNTIVAPDTELIIPNKGMPNSKVVNQRGDLLVNYDIQFPKSISNQDKQQLAQILAKYE